MTDQNTSKTKDEALRETYDPGSKEEAGLAHGGGGFGARDLQRQAQPETAPEDKDR